MSTQSCIDCPSLIQGDEAADHFSVDSAEVAGFVFCARFGHVLGDQDGVREGLAIRNGETCVSYGEPRPTASPVNLQSGLNIPRPDLLVPVGTKPSFCGDCKNLDVSSVTPVCAATGMICFSAKHTEIADACDFGRIGNPDEVVDSRLADWSTTPVALSATSLGGGTTVPTTSTPSTPPPASQPFVAPVILEPVNYNSDAKVSPEHYAKGINAWRAVETPRGKIRHLPIFRTDFFSEEEQARIPRSGADYGDPALFIDHDHILVEFAVQSYMLDLNLALIGDPGTGKTEGVRYLAWMMNLPFWRITYNEETDPDAVLGFYHFGDHEVPDGQGGTKTATGTYFKPGELPRNIVKIGMGLSDEPNTAREAIQQTYRSFNDSSREIVVYGERFVRHDYCFHVMAMNPHYDFRNIGAKPLASADSRRLAFKLMTPPNDDQIKEILQRSVMTLDKRTIPDEVMKLILNAGKDLREMAKNNQLPDHWTTSQEVKVARLVEDFGFEGAYRRAYFDYIDPETAQVAMNAVLSHVRPGSEYR